jgi:hypothetical protein
MESDNRNMEESDVEASRPSGLIGGRWKKFRWSWAGPAVTAGPVDSVSFLDQQVITECRHRPLCHTKRGVVAGREGGLRLGSLAAPELQTMLQVG